MQAQNSHKPIYSYRRAAHFLILCPQTHYLSDVKQVDLQEEGSGAGSHLLGCAADGETHFTA